MIIRTCMKHTMKGVYFIKNNNYLSMHWPLEHFLQPRHKSLVPYLHCPAVQVSVAPEQSSSVVHPFVIEKCIKLR